MTSTIRLGLFVFAASLGTAQAAPPNWSGPWSPCNHHADLLSREHVDLGVKLSTANAILARQFARAMDFWAGVLDLDWHEVNSDDCSIQLIDGSPQLFNIDGECTCVAARAQFPDRPDFQGWIAFNPEMNSTVREMFRDSVHEIGHLLGLPHNPDSSSVMFFSDFGQDVSLDEADLEALAARHKLRKGVLVAGPAHGYVAVSAEEAGFER